MPEADIVTWLAEASDEYPRNTEGDVTVLSDGTLLACWTRFYGGSQDWAGAEIAARTSQDGGRTWSEPFVLQANVGLENVMSASFLRERASGDLMLFYLVKNSPRDLRCYCRRSADEGRTWSEPVLVTDGPGYHIVNNARVVQLSSGRIIVPASWVEDVFAPGAHIVSTAWYSDDSGRTWKRAADSVDVPKRGAMEPGVVELSDGRLLMIIRTQLGQIYKSYSFDEGESWSDAEPLGLRAPEAPSTIVRIPSTGELVIFYSDSLVEGADHGGPRCPLSVAISSDEGETWQKTADIETDCSFNYAYLSCTFHHDRALLTYYVGFRRPDGQWRFGQRFRSMPVDALRG